MFFLSLFFPNGVNIIPVLCPGLCCRYTGVCPNTLFKTKSIGTIAKRRAWCWPTETLQHPACTYYLLWSMALQRLFPRAGNALLYKQATLGRKIVPRRESGDALEIMGSISVILLGKVTSKIYLNRAEIWVTATFSLCNAFASQRADSSKGIAFYNTSSFKPRLCSTCSVVS